MFTKKPELERAATLEPGEIIAKVGVTFMKETRLPYRTSAGNQWHCYSQECEFTGFRCGAFACYRVTAVYAETGRPDWQKKNLVGVEGGFRLSSYYINEHGELCNR